MTDVTPLTFVVCVNDDAILQANLLTSPCLGPGSPHELITVPNPGSAADGLNEGLERARNELIVCVHQDVILPQGWDTTLAREYRLAERCIGPLGVAGVYGVGDAIETAQQPLSAERIGWIIDRGRLLRDGPMLPARAATLDEVLLVLPRGTPLRFDPALGFHLYGADICLQAQSQGLPVAVLPALCRHNSRSVGLPPSFFPSAKAFADKWEGCLPVATSCVAIDRAKKLYLLGNTPEGGKAAPAGAEVTPAMAETPGDRAAALIRRWNEDFSRNPPPPRPDKPLLIDAFTYWNEADMLAFRLRMLAPLVDKFVIVESDRTFAGHEKPYYSEQFDFSPWKDKVILHRIQADTAGLNLADKPTEYDPAHDCWKIERQQRSAILDACKDFADTDFLLIGDVDEIPTREAVAQLKARQFGGIVALKQWFFYYDLTRLRQDMWPGTIWTPLAAARQIGAQALRDARGRTGIAAEQAGWHLSYFGGVKAIREKIKNFSHQEYNTPQITDATHVAACVKTGGDLFGNEFASSNPPPNFFPEYFREAVERKAWWGRQPRPQASVIVPCWNQLEFTRLCVQALFRHTNIPWELIVIDNGSTDDTPAYLETIRRHAPVPVRVITNPKNLGFPAAVNQGLKAARGDYLVLLNNDAMVTDAWLQQLIALTQPSDRQGPPIGMAGPMSNYVTPPQLVQHVPYRDLPGMEAFARAWRDRHRGTWSTVPKLSGFCLLMTRAAYRAIGGLDERFGLGFFDDDDLAVRARAAGFDLAVAHDLFVHHFGSRSFVGGDIDADALLEENERRFAAKWGQQVPRGRRVELRPWNGNVLPTAMRSNDRPDDDAPSDPLNKAKVSLTMIVRNEEANLPHCLASVEGLFDEIVVVDTGSTDRTKEIALEYGARAFDFPWIDDFAAARNEALRHATGDYALWLDADDVLDPPERDKLKTLLARLRTDRHAAYVIRCACDPGPDEGQHSRTVVDHVRLFPLRGDIRFTFRVHEQIMPAVSEAGIPVRWTDVTVRHTGYTDPALVARKHERDKKILLAELADKPEHPYILFNLGNLALEGRSWQEALDFHHRSLLRSHPDLSITRKLYSQLARAHEGLGDSDMALRACHKGLSFYPEDGELWFRKAALHMHREEYQKAEASFRRILPLRPPEQFCSVDHGIYGHLTRRNLALLAAMRRAPDEARQHWQAVLAECPGDPEAQQRLAKLATVAA